MKTETITIGIEQCDAILGSECYNYYRVLSSVFGVTTRTRDAFDREVAERLACDLYDMLDEVNVPVRPILECDVHDPSGRKRMYIVGIRGQVKGQVEDQVRAQAHREEGARKNCVTL